MNYIREIMERLEGATAEELYMVLRFIRNVVHEEKKAHRAD